MTAILNQAITTAVTGVVGSTFELRGGLRILPINLNFQMTFTYGSGGTTAACWAQTSLDGGTTWNDVVSFGGLTTSSVRNIMNVSSATPKLVPFVLTDGTLASNTALDGLVGEHWRIKYTTTGTYAATTLRVDIFGNGITLIP